MKYKKISLSDITTFRPYLEMNKGRTCDYTIGGIFMWRDYFNMEYCAQDGVLFSRLRDENNKLYYNLPLSENMEAALSRLVTSSPEDTISFCTVPEDALPFLSAHYSLLKIEEQNDFFDYLYQASDLVELSGKKYSGQRNQIHQFLRSVGSWEYCTITKETLPEVYDYFVREYAPTIGTSDSEITENEMVLEVLSNFDIYGMSGGLLRADGHIVGFSLGEIVGDTLFTHIEKADRSYKGAYQMLVNQFARNIVTNDVKYINREEDMGDPGLRTAKNAYHPICLLKKYIVEVKCNESCSSK